MPIHMKRKRLSSSPKSPKNFNKARRPTNKIHCQQQNHKYRLKDKISPWMVPLVSTKASQRQKVTDWSRCFMQSKDSQKRDHIYTLAWGSVGKESAWNVGNLVSIPGLRRSPGKGKGYPLQYSWASLVAELVENPPAMWEIWVRSLGWEEALEKGKATHSSILVWRIPWTV